MDTATVTDTVADTATDMGTDTAAAMGTATATDMVAATDTATGTDTVMVVSGTMVQAGYNSITEGHDIVCFCFPHAKWERLKRIVIYSSGGYGHGHGHGGYH